MAQPIIVTTNSPLHDADPFAAWSCCAQRPGSTTHPDELPTDTGWLPARAPGTVAGALQAAGQWDFNKPRDLDAEDWWYRTTFAAPEGIAGQPCHLCFDGLATLAEVWLNGQRILATDNMFRAYRVEVNHLLLTGNDLVICFRSLAEDLKTKRPRPRWKTNLVSHQQLRWHRSSLLGRIPGWSPPAPAVGPWRAVRLDTQPFTLSNLRLSTTVEGDEGVVTLSARVNSATALRQAILQVGDRQVEVNIQRVAGSWRLQATLRLANPPLWWPHTHGEQPLFDCSLHFEFGAKKHIVPCSKIGFRQLQVSQDDGLAIKVNGVPVYCRGVCWTLSDILDPGGSEETVARDLRLARDAGVNMLRVGGTMVYESDRFYQLCDELGILVWQDFMFANMDYPVDDACFAENIETEAAYQVDRLAPHPCIAVFCGNSEVEQQAAMLGMPRELWRNHWFGAHLPELCSEHSPGTAYVPSTPSGGVMPFHVRDGITHYYGVGAYLRSPSELRKADVKFTPECLAFANVPAPDTVNSLLEGAAPAAHHPRWKGRVPRDTGAGWDFEDVRDFYLQHFFGLDPVKLRSFDMARYLQLSRVVSGEMMAQTFAEWRSGHTKNHGALVWFFKDLWPGAGWGAVDSFGIPKAAYYYLRRSWQTQQITVTDEGLDGLHLHVTNESSAPLHGSVELLLLKDGHIVVARQQVTCRVGPRDRQTFASDVILGGFYDVTYSYRFGPAHHDLAIATLYDDRRRVLSEAFYFVKSCEPVYLQSVHVEVEAVAIGQGCYQVALHSDHFLQSASFDVKGFLPDDNYFHLPPSRHKAVRFTPLHEPGAKFRATLEALNLKNSVPIRLKETTA